MKPQIYHVDAFTSEPFRGNSAGVVLHADTLSDAQMQLIARELRHSETAFLLKSEESDVRIRYFTPTVEVPICGHATVAAHYVRATVLTSDHTNKLDILILFFPYVLRHLTIAGRMLRRRFYPCHRIREKRHSPLQAIDW